MRITSCKTNLGVPESQVHSLCQSNIQDTEYSGHALTFDLELGGVPHPGRRVGRNARILSGVGRRQAGDAEEARVRV